MEALLIRCKESLDPTFNLRETNVTGIYPPLGIAYIASNLKKAGIKVDILDLEVLELTRDELKTILLEMNPALVGISSTSLIWPQVVKIAEFIKRVLPKSFIIAGGPQIDAYPAESISSEFIDAGCIGEGEYMIAELMLSLKTNKKFSELSGIVFKKNSKINFGVTSKPIEDLDGLPFPAYELLPLSRYWATGVKRPFFTMITTRGCPYRCSFCSQEHMGYRLRQRSAKNVVSEIEKYVKGFKAKEIIMFDETFTADRKRVLEICDLIIQRNLIFRWNIRTRVDSIDEEILRSLRRAGCYSLHMGVESGVQKILDDMDKQITLPQIRQAFRLASRLGFETRGYFMVGYPGENLSTIRETVKFSKKLSPEWASFTVAVAHPKTKIYTKALYEGRFKSDYWKDRTLCKISHSPPYFTTSEYDLKKLFWIKNRAYLSFYLRPRVLVRKLLKLASFRGAKDLIRATRGIFNERGLK
jgi:radical SAM superfamily enzyme YgiQ (UPF0313 family)